MQKRYLFSDSFKNGENRINFCDTISNEVMKKIIDEMLSECCKKPIYIFKNTSSGGLWCTCCDKEVFNTINKKKRGGDRENVAILL